MKRISLGPKDRYTAWGQKLLSSGDVTAEASVSFTRQQQGEQAVTVGWVVHCIELQKSPFHIGPINMTAIVWNTPAVS